MGLTGAAVGFNNTLQQVLADRYAQQLAERQYQDHLRQQQFDNDMKVQQFQSNEELKRAQLDATAEARKQATQQHERDYAIKLDDTIPEGAIPYSPETEGTIKTLKTVNPGVDADERPAVETGPLLPGDTGAALPKRFIKAKSYKQQSDSDERERKIADAQAKLDESSRYHDLTNQNAQSRLEIERMRADLAKAAADNKAAQGPKLNQRDNDTVVTVHQMMPRVNEVIAELEKSVANKPKPQGGLMGAIKQLPEKAARVGESTAYSLGLAQPSDISNRIQLESLMQVMGSTPYLRGSRNFQFLKQIQQHLADPSGTDEANLERLKQLQRILPEMEQAIYDVSNHGVVPHEHGAGMAPVPSHAPTAGKQNDPLGIR